MKKIILTLEDDSSGRIISESYCIDEMTLNSRYLSAKDQIYEALLRLYMNTSKASIEVNADKEQTALRKEAEG